jgi:phosphatidate cytidylyltransferase
MAESLGARVASGVVLAVVGAAAAYVGGWAFNALVAVAAVAMLWEWDRLCGGSGRGPLLAVHTAVAVIVVGFAGLGRPVEGLVAAALGAAVAVFVAAQTRRHAGWALAGLAYTVVPALAAVWLRADSGAGRVAVLWLFAVIWATDTAAYFTGRTLGGPKLAPRLSPGKTWAGVAGGTAAACLAGLAVAIVADFGPVWALVLASAVLSLVGQGGDLAISGMKRHFDAKDSGHIIPGHGGVLDRLDSTVASVLLLAALLFALQAWGLRWP